MCRKKVRKLNMRTTLRLPCCSIGEARAAAGVDGMGMVAAVAATEAALEMGAFADKMGGLGVVLLQLEGDGKLRRSRA